MAQIETDKIHIQGMNLLEFNIQPGDRGASRDGGFRVQQKAGIFHDPGLAFVVVELRFYCAQIQESDSVKGATGSFLFNFIFTIDNLSELMVEDPGNSFPVPDPQLAATLTGIAYSTARGILWARTAGTAIEGFALPVVNPIKLLVESSEAEEKAKAEATKE